VGRILPGVNRNRRVVPAPTGRADVLRSADTTTRRLDRLVIRGVLFRAGLPVADASFQEYHKLIEPETEPPTDPLKTSSSAFLLAQNDRGRARRGVIFSEPTREDISDLSGRGAPEPVCAYVGPRSADTPEVNARLALEELDPQTPNVQRVMDFA
jgi:uncharacterized membrane protein